jgi:lipoyl(octanoyl) transferase
VSTELSYFDLIVPCGIPDVAMTSIQREVGRAVTLGEVAPIVARYAAEVFDLVLRQRDDLPELLGVAPQA